MGSAGQGNGSKEVFKIYGFQDSFLRLLRFFAAIPYLRVFVSIRGSLS